jgi:dTDP-4-dehydrorhamnose reductase
MATILITGAGGLLGANLVLDALASGHRVIAVDHQYPIRHPEVDSLAADLCQAGAAESILAAKRPDWVIHCAAATSVDGCEADPAMAFRLNRDMAQAVARGARAAGSRLVHISTDAVFDGERGGYREEDVPSPINVYGRSKLEGERAVAAADPQALIVRTNLYGWNAQDKQSLAEWFLSNLEAGKRCRGFTDVWFSPILVNDLGRLLFAMLEAGLAGVYHVAGGECVSKYDFGVLIARVFGFDPQLIRPAATPDGPPRARRGRQLCLRSLRIDALAGLRLPAAAEGLTRWKQLGEEGLAGRLRGLIDPQPQAGARDV